jgi:glutamate/tyrosine decarboxylase-like PLP-dependent enzyme
VLERLAAAADPGLVASPGPRFFGFVVGGTLPVAIAADWMTSAWDQNAGLEVLAPAAAVVEEVCERWIVELLGLPAGASAGFVTGGQGANTTCLAAARHAVLRDAGWDVEERGLIGAPAVDVYVGEEAHTTIFSSLRLLGLGAGRAQRIPADDQGRMDAAALAARLGAADGPAIVCAQAGEINTGSFDPFEAIADACAARGAWLHVDGAFGLWAAAAPGLRGLVTGVERADSWATDAHKWLNVPYDSGIAIVGDRAVHRAALALTAAYFVETDAGRDNVAYVPETSRRARGFPVYAALRTLGRRGVAELVQRCCDLARQMAGALAAEPGIRVLNDVVLNQVLVELDDPGATGAVLARIQADGTCWLGGTTWHGAPAIRVSFSNWSTTLEDVTRSAAAISEAVRQAS